MARHEWRIDAIEEGVAAVEEDGERMIHLPLWIFPRGVAEGDVLRVESEADADRSELHISIDRAATQEALEHSKQQIEATPPQKDPGGDIRL